MKRYKNKVRLIVAVIAIVILGSAALAISHSSKYFSEHTYSGTVTDKVVKTSGDSNSTSSTYMVFVKLDDGTTRVFEDTDSWVYMKFNSSDVYGELQVGHHYTFKVYGVRNTFLSWYENIVNVTTQ